MTTTVKASARKSLGAYKPIIVYPTGKTEVCEQSSDRFDKYTVRGIVPGNKMARGTVYCTREEAVAAAQRVIDLRREDAEKRAESWAGMQGRERGVEHAKNEARLWQSTKY